MHKHNLTRLRPVKSGVASQRLQAIAQQIYEAIDSPKSLAASILFRNGEYAQLVAMEVNPLDYVSAERFSDDYFAVKFLSKFPSFSHPELQPLKKAEESFTQFELQCRKTNQKFKSLEEDPRSWDPSMRGILYLARRKIASVLKDPDLDAVSEMFGWGPGATSVSRGSYTSAYIKYAQRLDVTSNSLIMGHCCINSTPAWVNCQLQTDEFPSVWASLTREAFNIVRGNEVMFVPKNAKTHRVIAKEPHVNSYLQKGFGRLIRSRLLAFAGVDLKDQTRNQRLARLGSLTGELATIDLQGASDTISTELVKLLLPDRWFKLLDSVRSKQGLFKGQWIHYEKFSSMGNAFTFELESLIFWALCSSTLHVQNQGRTLSVYGDDIIVPASAYSSVVKVLEFAGFSTNDKKSFSSGPFRESCGQDYFFGTGVRPIFLKEELSTVESLFRIANSIRRYAHRRNFSYGCDLRFEHVWKTIVSHIPKQFRIFIPEGFGDVGLIGNFDEATPISAAGSRKRSCGWEGYFFRALTRTPSKERMTDKTAGYTAVLSAIGLPWDTTSRKWDVVVAPAPEGWMLSKRHVTMTDQIIDRYSETPSQGFHNLRDMTRPKVAWLHTRGWYDLGPWQ